MEMSGINQDENNTASDGTCDDSSITEMEKKINFGTFGSNGRRRFISGGWGYER